MKTLVKQYNLETQELIEFTMMICGECGVPFLVPKYLKDSWHENGNGWYCPNGHKRIFSKTLSQKVKDEYEQKLKSQTELTTQYRNDCVKYQAEKLIAERQLSRVEKGVCPKCKRTFKNLQRHMNTKHKCTP